METLTYNNIDLREIFESYESDDSLFDKQRNASFDAFVKFGIPTNKHEDWKYTNLSPIIKSCLNFNESEVSINKDFIDNHLINNCNHIVLVNGVYIEQISTIIDADFENIILDDITEADDFNTLVKKSENGLAHLNTAFCDFGLSINIPKGAIIQHPIQILNVNDNSSFTFGQVRLNVNIGENAQVEFIDTNYSAYEGDFWSNAVTEVFVAKNAIGKWYKLQNNVEDANLTDNFFIEQRKDSSFKLFTISVGGKLTRNNIAVDLEDEHIESFLYGTSAISNKQHVDHHTLINHNFPECVSNEHYKGVYGGESRGVFSGKVYVAKDAQKTNAFQSNNNILLSDSAHVDTKPQLEIFADDVKCSHGATVGQLDEEALFYMQARAIGKVEAHKLLTKAFMGEVIEKIDNEFIKEIFIGLIEDKLENV